MKKLFAAAGIVLVLGGPVGAWDIRDCPMSSLTFASPWTGTSFKVQQAAESIYYLCNGKDEVFTDERPEGCKGPFGEVLLSGTMTEGKGRQKQLIARYTQMPAAPCCLWDYQQPGAITPRDAQAEWHSSGSGPLLREWPIAAIEIDSDLIRDEDVGRYPAEQLIAVACEELIG